MAHDPNEAIRLFVGTDRYQRIAELALEASVRKNTSVPVDITWMRQGDPGFEWGGLEAGWATPFSMFRWCVPELCEHKGRAIYLDVDMVVLGDLLELWTWPMNPETPGVYAGRMATKADVIVWQCENVPAWPREAYHGRHAQVRQQGASLLHPRRLPERWNHVDKVEPDTSLLHMSKLSAQPWNPYPPDKRRFDEYVEHPDPEACRVFWSYVDDNTHGQYTTAGGPF